MNLMNLFLKVNYLSKNAEFVSLNTKLPMNGNCDLNTKFF